jgi:hypothetical protein
MIAAAAALQLPSAQPSKQDIEDCKAMVKRLDDHVRKHMAFGGPPPLTVPFREMSMAASQLLAYAMNPIKWNITINLMSEAPRFQGGQPVPHSWIIQMQPMVDVYREAFASIMDVVIADLQPAA